MKNKILSTTVVLAAFGGLGAPTLVAAADPDEAGPKAEQLAEVVVTARRRDESMQDVPIAITALSADSLRERHIRSNQDLSGVVPGLTVSSNGQQRSAEVFTLRGQGTGFMASQSVVMYIAETPVISGLFTATQGGPGAFLDLENLQVLKGPQGTLFGRNTTGGAVVLVPAKPTNEFGGYVQGQVGNHADHEAEAVLNVPLIGDKLLVRVAGRAVERDGFTTNIASGQKLDDLRYWTGRIGITFKPTASIDNYLMLFDTDEHDNGTGFVGEAVNSGRANDRTGIAYNQLYGIYNFVHGTPPFSLANIANPCAGFDLLNGTTGCGQSLVAAQNALGARTVNYAFRSSQRLLTWGASDTFAWTLADSLTFRNIASYSTLKQLADGSNSGFPIPTGISKNAANFYTTNAQQWTEEAQFQGTARDGNLRYTVGGYAEDYWPGGPQGNDNINGSGLVLNQVYDGVTRRSVAGYAQAVYNLRDLAPALDGLNLTAGYRYTWDHNSGFANAPITLPILASLGAPTQSCLVGTTAVYPNCNVTADQRTSAPNWLVGADYRFTPEVMGYFHVSEGYKGGGFNALSVNPETRTFLPEYNKTYEVGTKTDLNFAGMPSRINLAVYRSDYTNMQRSGSDANDTQGIGAATFNTGSATIQGVELEATIRPTHRLDFGATYAYTDARYDTFLLPIPGAAAGQLDCTGELISAGHFADMKCIPFAYVAKNQFSVSGHYTLPLPDSAGSITLGGNVSYNSSVYTSPTALPSQEPFAFIGPYGIANFTIDWKGIMGSSFDGQFFVTNAFDRLYRISNSGGYGTGNGLETAIYGAPRMFGAQIKYSFGSFAR